METGAALTRSDFASAVRDALRQYVRVDLLAANPLLRARVLARSDGRQPAASDLKALLAQTADALFASERDRRLYRTIELTYFNPAPKQEAAAERLGMSFSTYRRQLTSGVDRMTEWLWQQERSARPEDAAPASPAVTSASAESIEARAPAPEARAPALRSPLSIEQSPTPRPRLSIVVLPFLNLSTEAGVDYLVDGVVDALITDLSSSLPGSFVISRSTAFTYRGRPIPIRQIGAELGIRYVLEGSVQVDGTRVRVNVQLIDALTDEHLWAERFDKERREILEVQDEIVGRLARSVGIQMVRNEAGRTRPDDEGRDATDLVLRARALISDTKRRENAEEAISLFRRALRLDPACAAAMLGIGLTRIYQVINLYRLDGREALLDEAEDMISRAAASTPDHLETLKVRGLLLRARGRFAEAMAATEAVIARNPAEPTAYREMGLNNLYVGETRAAAEWFRRADAIAPRDPERWTWLQGLGRALMQLGDDSGAVAALSLAMESNPAYVRGKAMLAAAAALAGDAEAARRYLADYALVEPAMTIQRFAGQRSSVPPGAVSAIYRRECERIMEGLRRAGMPDDVDPELELTSF